MARAVADSPSATDVDLPQLGELIDGKYRIEKVLGGGGMGVVFAAHHELLDQRVAVKVLTARDKTAYSRFALEARSTARLKSEHVARVMDVGSLATGAPFIVLEYLEGCDLEELLELNGQLPIPDAVDYALQALEGIAQAHALGIIHRDLKPANLFLAVQRSGASLIKILDFGISKSIASRRSGKTGSVTGEHATLGSPRYMSPEQIRSTKNVDTRSDIWSLGVVLFELISGRQPFTGESFGETFAAILESDAPLLTDVVPGCPSELAAAVARCMRRDRDERFRDVNELAWAIGSFGTEESAARVQRIEQTLLNAKAITEGGDALPPMSGRSLRGLRAAPTPVEGDAEIALREAMANSPTLDAPPSERPVQVTGGPFTSDTPRSDVLANTVPSFARRGRKRAMIASAAAVAVLSMVAGIAVARVTMAHRPPTVAHEVAAKVEALEAPATPALPAPTPAPSEPDVAAPDALVTHAPSEPSTPTLAPASVATPTRPLAPLAARPTPHAKPSAKPPAPPPAHHAPAAPKKRPSVLDSPD